MVSTSTEAPSAQVRPCFGVTVRTPAGASSAFAVNPSDTAAELTERAVTFFVDRQLLEPGPFRLGLVRDGQIVDLEPGDHLRRRGIVEGDVLHLITCEDQIDGSTGCFTRAF